MDREVSLPDRGSGVEDVQSRSDERGIAVQAVGIRGLRHPIAVEDAGGIQQTVATARLAVELPAERRGTHMSRFVSLLQEWREPLSAQRLPAFLGSMAARLDAHAAEAEFAFPFFLEKHAPISGASSRTDYETALRGRLAGGKATVEIEISVPATTLCPCSKSISRYGAHNQRSNVKVTVETRSTVALAELVRTVEQEVSAPVYALIKRIDEKFLTERAYENPKFVEDVARDIALRFREDRRIARFSVDVENFESIHNHSAYAQIRRPA